MSGVAEDDDFDDLEAFDHNSEESGVQLGTVIPLQGPQDHLLFRNIDWHGWDGGKAGGWPVWLNPRDLPAPQGMRCGECSHPLSFLVQLYCPLDHEDDAFHRCLYVFCCPKASCSKNSSVKALRCQLPRENPFYPYAPGDKTSKLTEKQGGANPAIWGVSLCCLCGQLAKSACSKCRSARYCGRQHQTQHWKHGHKKECSAGAALGVQEGASEPGNTYDAGGESHARNIASVFREFEVDVRPEPPPAPIAPGGRPAEETLAAQMDLTGVSEEGDAVEEDEDSKLSQIELDKIAGVHGVKDKVTLQFLARTQANPQVIRYDAVGAGPLWSSSNGMPAEEDVPPCAQCGRPRKFEFQVMPHLLHHLGVEADAKALDSKAAASGMSKLSALTAGECMDWGTLAVYTCPDSCPSQVGGVAKLGEIVDEIDKAGGGSSAYYVEEFVWRQPPP